MEFRHPLVYIRDIKKSSNFSICSPPGDRRHDEVKAVSKQIIERQSDEKTEVTSNVHQQLHVVKYWIEKGFRFRNVHCVPKKGVPH